MLSGQTGYLRRRLARTRAKLARLLHAPRTTHPALTRLMIGVTPPPLARLANETSPDDALLTRVASCFAAARRLNASSTASMWDEQERLRAPFIDALAAGDLAALRTAFDDLFGGVLLDGMSHGSSLFADEARNPYRRGFVGLRTIDCLLSLAEALGESPVPCYAQMTLPRYLDSLAGDHAALLARLERRLGFPLGMPAAGAPYVVRLGGCATAPDVLRHAYVAHRLQQLGLGPRSRVLEIGGGFGMFALCARRAGLGHVTIVDLPFVGAIQMGYLGTVMGAGEVAGVGEAEASVTLLPPDSVAAMADDSFDVVVNCDSLPEMGRETALGYLRAIRRLAPRFVSINQEAQKVHGGAPQNRVVELVEEVGGLRRASRHRHWMEQGYVEEVFERG
jgi:hypothetical protein